MPSLFPLLDFAEEDRRRMAEVIDLFLEQDNVDEFGPKAIRESLADLNMDSASYTEE